jgi:hypothetical protein
LVGGLGFGLAYQRHLHFFISVVGTLRCQPWLHQ